MASAEIASMSKHITPKVYITITTAKREREREMFYLTTHSTHFIYGYMASDIWLRTILIVRKETRCRPIGYSYRLTPRVLLYAPSHRQDNTYHGLCYTSCGALAGTRNSTMGPPMKDRSDDPSHALPLSYVPLPVQSSQDLAFSMDYQQAYLVWGPRLRCLEDGRSKVV